MAGRKNFGIELRIEQRYADLAEPAFKFIKECLESDNKADKKWAYEQLNKGFARMIPQIQKISGDENNNTPIPVTILKDVRSDQSSIQDTEPQEAVEDNSGGDISG